ncbi:MAG: peptide deformylase [Candidatus Berkiellales bacterium]
MSTLKVLVYPHKGLREVAPIVTSFDKNLQQTVEQLFDTMYAGQGCGLAATQVGILSRIFVMDISDDQNQPQCFINPVITAKEGEVESAEGCLSFPGIFGYVKRAKQVTMQYQNEHGETLTLTADGLAAHCIQHESDHLNGILFIDYLSKLKRTLLLKKMEKLQRVAS